MEKKYVTEENEMKSSIKEEFFSSPLQRNVIGTEKYM
jgi:hypothetical protein